jgi:diaminopimelate decarboxylase
MSWRVWAQVSTSSPVASWSVLAAGGRADRVFSGVGKTREDMRRALEVGVHCFNVESTDELERLQVVAAELGVAPISLRVNPDVDAGTHPYISTGLKENKFGIAIADAEDVYVRAAQLPNLEVVGVDCHIGSQLTTLRRSSTPSTACWRWSTASAIAASTCATSTSVAVSACVIAMKSRHWWPTTSRPCASASAARPGPGVRTGPLHRGQCRRAADPVEYLKHTEHKDFAIVDAAMNDLIRPALYQAWMGVTAVKPAQAKAVPTTSSARSARPATSWQGSSTGPGRRRSAGRAFGRRLRVCHELQLQHPRPCR